MNYFKKFRSIDESVVVSKESGSRGAWGTELELVETGELRTARVKKEKRRDDTSSPGGGSLK